MDTEDDDVSFEVGQKADGTLWTCSVACKAGLSEKEFAAALISLAEDIISGETSFDSAPEAEEHDEH